jgi:hypothetical protein
MKQNKLYGVILAMSMLIFSGCGNDKKENPDAPTGPYAFINATTPKTISRFASEGTEISVQLVKFGLAEAGQSVQMRPFDSKYGEIENLVVETDENGVAIFKFIAPEGSDFTELKGQETTLTAVFEDPEEDVNVAVNEDAAPVILLTQDFLLQFR